MQIEVSENDLKIILQSLKHRYVYKRDLKNKFINDHECFNFFFEQANSISEIHNRLLKYIDKEKIKDNPDLTEISLLKECFEI